MQEFAKRPVTIEEFEKAKTQDGAICELIDGIVMMSRRSIDHQKILTNLSGELYQHFKGKTCKIFSEIEIKLNNDILVPDISIICDFTKLLDQRYDIAATIAIEILSPSTMFNDFVNKAMTTFEKFDVLKSNIFEDLKIKLEDIFE